MANIDASKNKEWNLNQFKKINPNSVLVEGLPGMGNVGKIAADFMVEQLKAEKVVEIYSHNFPHCVFVNENNLVDLPVIQIYQKKIKTKNILFLVGDIQPLDERSCYSFCNFLLDFLKKNKVKEVITLGGIGQPQIPEKPKVYITGNDAKTIKKYSTKKTVSKIHGVVGPIVGVTGLLLGVASNHKISSVSYLAETLGHPNFLGIKGSREILAILNEKLSIGLDLKKLDSEIKSIEKEINQKTKLLQKLKDSNVDVDYIG